MDKNIITKNTKLEEKHKYKFNKILLVEIILIVLTVLISFRDIISLYTTENIKIFQDIVILILFLIVAIKNRRHLKIDRSDILLIILAAISVLTTIFNRCDILNCIFQLRSILIIYILYFTLKNLPIKINYKKIVYTFCVISTLLTIFAIIEIIFEKKVLFPSAWADSITYADNFRRAYSLLNNPNTYAAFTTLSYILIDSSNNKSRLEKIFTHIMLSASVISVGLSASRSGIIILTVYLLYKTIRDIKTKQINISTILKISLTILISIGIILATDSLRNTINSSESENAFIPENTTLFATITKVSYSAPNQNTKSQNNQLTDRVTDLFSGKVIQTSVIDGRLQHVEKAIDVFKEHPIFGTGLGTFGSSGSLRNKPLLYSQYDIQEGFYADNEYIVILVETGAIGFTLFACFLIYFIKENWKFNNTLIVIIILLILGLFYNIIEIFPLMYIAIIIITMGKSRDKNLHSNPACSITKG